MIQVTKTLALDERDLDERFVRASGPGGQNVNKVATAVELRFDVRRAALPDDVKTRLLSLAGSRVTDDGVLIIDSREHRTQRQNRDAARDRLVKWLRAASRRPRRRVPTAPTAGARERRLAAKKRRARVKARRVRPPDDDTSP
jgi:ribosome-associated protein